MTYRFDAPSMGGYPPIENVVPIPTNLQSLPISPGFIATAEDPVWGPGEFIFARAGAGIRLYGLCTLLPVWDVTNKVFTYNATESPVQATVGLARPLYVYQGNVAITAGQYGWFQQTGRTPINGVVAFPAADVAVFRGAAVGQVTPTASIGAQLLNARVITPSTQTVVTPGSGVIGSNQIFVGSTQGFFVGGYLSGTGVGAAAIVSFIDPLGRYILATVVNSAAVTGNVTITYNNATIFYPVVEMNRLGAQGQIT